MSVSGDASEQIVRLSLEGFEVLAKLTGSGAKNVAAMLYTIMKDKKQTKGKTRLNNMLKAGKPLKIFSIKNEDLQTFKYEAKKYGILYSALVDRKHINLDGMTDIMVKDEDASRINRIVERFKLTTIDTAKIDTEVTKAIENREAQRKELGVQKKSKEELLEEVLQDKPIQKEETKTENGIKYTKHCPGLRDFTLANTDLVGGIATKMSPIVNYTLGMKPVKSLMHATIGVDKHREFPKYSAATFESWYKKNAKENQMRFSKNISYFHGCYVNYNFPKLGMDLIKIMNAIGYGVHLLDKEKCCGVALIANGMPKKAARNGERNIAAMQKSVVNGRQIITTSSTCTFTMRDEYEHLLHLDNSVAKDNLSLATRYIYRLVESGEVKLAFRSDYKKTAAYHTACHMEKLGWAVYSVGLLKMIPGLKLEILDSQCCGIGGTYGFKKENYPISQAIGAPLFKRIKELGVDFVSTDCETCKWQIEMSAGVEVLNPISILADALDVEATIELNKKQ